MKISHDSASVSDNDSSNPMDKLLAKLSEQSAALTKQQEALKTADETVAYSRTVEYVSSASASLPITPAVVSFTNSTAPTTTSTSLAGDEGPQIGADEMLRLKLELEAARGKIARMDQELAQTRITKHTLDQAIGTPSEHEFTIDHQANVGQSNHLQANLNTNARPQIKRDTSWPGDDCRSDTSDGMSSGGFNRSRAIWNNDNKPTLGQGPISGFQPSEALASSQWMNRGYGQPFVETPLPFPGPPMHNFRPGRVINDPDLLMPAPAPRRANPGGRFNNRAVGSYPHTGSNSSYDGYTPSSTPFGSNGSMGGSTSGVAGPMGMPMPGGMSNQMPNGMTGSGGVYSGYQPQPIGTPLSPHAPEFNASSIGWKNDVSSSTLLPLKSLTIAKAVATEGQTYLPTTEPLNYRRLLDRTVNCNWKYIVDKIVCNNDQQASIFLQQKLKVGTTEQKYDIVEAIVAQAYPLMVNRFGNFLVQRCFEHGTPEQVIKIAEAIRGNTLNLSMDAFGCHVVQKAFDSVPEDYKAIMVHELLRRIPETVIHRYACHVWQKLFELRWTESPPQIMKFVNEALRGMWHEVALGETGSLVVQNIFENCLEEDKV
jgi:hypothetical protein